MPTEDTPSGDEAQIRKLIEQWAAALRAKDLEGVLATFAPGARTYRLGTRRCSKIRTAGAEALAAWFPRLQ